MHPVTEPGRPPANGLKPPGKLHEPLDLARSLVILAAQHRNSGLPRRSPRPCATHTPQANHQHRLCCKTMLTLTPQHPSTLLKSVARAIGFYALLVDACFSLTPPAHRLKFCRVAKISCLPPVASRACNACRSLESASGKRREQMRYPKDQAKAEGRQPNAQGW